MPQVPLPGNHQGPRPGRAAEVLLPDVWQDVDEWDAGQTREGGPTVTLPLDTILEGDCLDVLATLPGFMGCAT